MPDEIDAIEGFTRAVEGLKLAFPTILIRSAVDPVEPNVQAAASIPPQPGLEYGIGFELVGDELHLDIGLTNFNVEWFPVTDPVVVDEFVDAIAGFVEGRYRVLESYIGDHIVRSELQRPAEGDSWKTLAAWSSLSAFMPWPRRRSIIRNSAATVPKRSGRGRLTSA